jgi:hypothetical protein
VDALENLNPEALLIQNHLREKQGLAPIVDVRTNLYCAQCNQWKPDEEFYQWSWKSYVKIKRRGRAWECKACSNARRMANRRKNAERERLSERARRRRRYNTDMSNTVTCPECGDEFHPWGLVSHRTKMHGLDKHDDV